MNTEKDGRRHGFRHVSEVVERVMAEVDRKRAQHAREARRRVVEASELDRAG